MWKALNSVICLLLACMCCKSDPAFIIFILLPFHNPYMLVLIFCLSFCCPLFMIHFPVLELFLLIRFWVYWIKCHMIIKGIVHMKKCSNWHKTCIMLKSQLYFFLFLLVSSVTVSDILFAFCLDDDGDLCIASQCNCLHLFLCRLHKMQHTWLERV